MKLAFLLLFPVGLLAQDVTIPDPDKLTEEQFKAVLALPFMSRILDARESGVDVSPEALRELMKAEGGKGYLRAPAPDSQPKVNGEVSGRFVLHSFGNRLVRLDTATGETWEFRTRTYPVRRGERGEMRAEEAWTKMREGVFFERDGKIVNRIGEEVLVLSPEEAKAQAEAMKLFSGQGEKPQQKATGAKVAPPAGGKAAPKGR
jgi:hypothetical protein